MQGQTTSLAIIVTKAFIERTLAETIAQLDNECTLDEFSAMSVAVSCGACECPTLLDQRYSTSVVLKRF